MKLTSEQEEFVEQARRALEEAQESPQFNTERWQEKAGSFPVGRAHPSRR